MNLSDYLTVFTICLSLVSVYFTPSLISPFFPYVAKQKGIGEQLSSVIFATTAFAQFIFQPLAGKLVPRFGYIASLAGGCLLVALSTITFGFFYFIQNGTLFFICCLVLRIFEAFGSSIVISSSFSLASEMFVEDLSKVTSYLELAYGIGFLTGPAVGSALYSSFDYIAPFIFNGALILLILPFTLLSIHRTLKNLQLRKFENEEEEQSETRNATYGSLLSDIPILFMCLVNFIANVCIEFFEPILGLYLIELKMKPQAVGFMYLFRSVTVTLCSPIVGHLLPFFQNKYSFILLGSSLQILALILLGPVRFIGVVDKNIYLIAVGIVLNACSVSFVFIATYEIIVKRVAYLGFEMDMKTNALISSLNITPYFIGMTFGFLISGTFYANFGFSLSASILIPLPLIALILQIISLIRFREELLTESNEMLPLNSSCGDTATTNAIDCGTHIPQESAYGSTH